MLDFTCFLGHAVHGKNFSEVRQLIRTRDMTTYIKQRLVDHASQTVDDVSYRSQLTSYFESNQLIIVCTENEATREAFYHQHARQAPDLPGYWPFPDLNMAYMDEFTREN